MSVGSCFNGLRVLQVGDGTVEFEPTPAESRSLIGSAYRVPYSLLVRFENDAIDETPEMSRILSSANPAGVPHNSRKSIVWDHAVLRHLSNNLHSLLTALHSGMTPLAAMQTLYCITAKNSDCRDMQRSCSSILGVVKCLTGPHIGACRNYISYAAWDTHNALWRGCCLASGAQFLCSGCSRAGSEGSGASRRQAIRRQAHRMAGQSQMTAVCMCSTNPKLPAVSEQ